MDRYAVIGSPIGHSLSPRIHTLFAEQTGQTLEYTAIEVTPEDFFTAVNDLVEQGYKGLNVTVPLKTLAWDMADRCNPAADRAKAVNTLRFEDDLRYGDNTDGPGLLHDLTVNHRLSLRGRHILVLGAGGAVRGVLMPLLKGKPATLTVANRTVSKAGDLAREFADLGEVQARGYDGLSGRYDLIINGTSAGLGGQLVPLPDGLLADGGAVYDMMYGAQPTAFVEWGRRQGAALSLDGLGMLVEQAAESFHLWRGVRPQTPPVIARLNAELGRR